MPVMAEELGFHSPLSHSAAAAAADDDDNDEPIGDEMAALSSEVEPGETPEPIAAVTRRNQVRSDPSPLLYGGDADDSDGEERGGMRVGEQPETIAGRDRIRLDSATIPDVAAGQVIGDERGELPEEMPELIAANESAGRDQPGLESAPSPPSGVADVSIGYLSSEEDAAGRRNQPRLNSASHTAAVVADESIFKESGNLGSEVTLELVPATPPDGVGYESVGEESGSLIMEVVVEELSELTPANGCAGVNQLEPDSVHRPTVTGANESIGEGGCAFLKEGQDESLGLIAGLNQVRLYSPAALEASETIGGQGGDLTEEELDEMPEPIIANEDAGGNQRELDSSSLPASGADESMGEERGILGLEEEAEETPELIAASKSRRRNHPGQELAFPPDGGCEESENLTVEEEVVVVEELLVPIAASGSSVGSWLELDSTFHPTATDADESIGEGVCASLEEGQDDVHELMAADEIADAPNAETINRQRGNLMDGELEEMPEPVIANEGAGGYHIWLDSPLSAAAADESVGEERGDLTLEEVPEEMPELIAIDESAGCNQIGLDLSPPFAAAASESVGQRVHSSFVEELGEKPEPISVNENACPNHLGLDCPHPSSTASVTESISEVVGNLSLKEQTEETPEPFAANESMLNQNDDNQEEELSQYPLSAENIELNDNANIELFQGGANLVKLEEKLGRGNVSENLQGPDLEMGQENEGGGICFQEEQSHYPSKPEGTEFNGVADIELLQGDVGLKKLEENLGWGDGLENIQGFNLGMGNEFYATHVETEEILEGGGIGVQENVGQTKDSDNLEHLQGDMNLHGTNEQMRFEEDSVLRESEKLEVGGVLESEGWGKHNVDLVESSPFEENHGSNAGLYNLQGPKEMTEHTAYLEKDSPLFAENLSLGNGFDDGQGLNEKMGLDEDANIPKSQERFEWGDIQEDAGWGEDNAYVKDSLPFGEQGSWPENPQSFAANTGWNEDAVRRNLEEKSGGGDYPEYTEWDYSYSLAENTGWSTGLEDGAHTKEGCASYENSGRREWSEGDADYGGSERGPNSFEYPQRPGERDCSYYLRTGNCQYGSNCKYNHPPNGGWDQSGSWQIPGLTQVPEELKRELPQRAARGQCKVYLATGSCKFGSNCRYSHPGQFQKVTSTGEVELNFLGLPLRPGERVCGHYMRTGTCKFLVSCRFHHPDPADTEQDSSGSKNGELPERLDLGATQVLPMSHSQKTSKIPVSFSNSKWAMLFPPPRTRSTSDGNDYQAPVSPSASNSSGRTSQQNSSIQRPAPIQRPAKIKNYTDTSYQSECPYFIKFGTCTYGSTCKYQHPQSPASTHPPSDTYNPIQQSAWTEGYTEKKDQTECPFMKYGTCETGSTCKYLHSPVSDSEWGENLPQKPSMELPHRPGERLCQLYLKTGTCNYKSACKFHHPSKTILDYLIATTAGRGDNQGQMTATAAGRGDNQGQMTATAAGRGDNQGQMDEYPRRPGEPKSLCGLTKEADGGVQHSGQVAYAERPGEPECWSLMKYGTCNLGAYCIYHHPPDRRPGVPSGVIGPNGLPLRPGRTKCPNFSRVGICTIGSICEFDHSVVGGSSVPAAGSRSGQGSFTDESQW